MNWGQPDRDHGPHFQERPSLLDRDCTKFRNFKYFLRAARHP